jgi:hypothetical protein
MSGQTTYSPPISCTDHTNSLESISNECPSKDKFDFIYLKTILFEKDGEYYETKCYPLGDVILPSDPPVSEDDYEALLDCKLERLRNCHIQSLEHRMQTYLEDNPNKRGTVYFSPANRLEFVNTEAKELYVFGFKDSSGKLEIQSESNFIIL